MKLEQKEKIISDIFDELRTAEKNFPGWPDNEFEGAAVLGEEFGELQQALLQHKYDGRSYEAVRIEAIQTAAMAIRFCLNMKESEDE